MKVLAKLRRGVLEITTANDCFYAEPSFWQRVYLLWTFRNFRRLSVRVLNQTQRQMIDRLSDAAHTAEAKGINPTLVIGRAEFSALPARKPLGPVINRSAQRTVETQHAASGTHRLRSVNEQATLSRFFARRTAETIAPLTLRRTRSHARYSLILTLASASLVIISAAVAQRFWINHGKSWPPTPASAVSLPPITHNDAQPITTAPPTIVAAPSKVSADANSLPRKAAELITPQTPSQLRSVTPASEVQAVNNLPKPVEIRGAFPVAEAGTENTRLRVFLPPLSVIYPTLPSSELSTDEKKEILVKALVNTNGTVDDVQVPGQTPKLATAIAKTVRQWRYEPYMLNGQPLAVETQMVFTVLGPDAMTVRFLPAGESSGNE